jgi:hypothetical protein
MVIEMSNRLMVPALPLTVSPNHRIISTVTYDNKQTASDDVLGPDADGRVVSW